MGLEDKAKNQAETAKGKVKEGVGDATDNERMQAEGEADQGSGNMKQAGEKVKDTFRDCAVTEGFEPAPPPSTAAPVHVVRTRALDR